mmetsp:Transcript_10793/g.16413  ORF Transcript_10793/g.16413 Transcript_10793/m.16413 type:complete len:714 (-) Transcript_10793:79-2220(-)
MAHHIRKNTLSYIKLSNAPVNALSLSVRDSLLRCIEEVYKDKPNGLIIYGDGKHFCAGADIKELARGKHLQAPPMKQIVAALDEFDIPVVALMQGATLGWGLELALACHWRVASPTVSLGFPEVNLGLIGGTGGSQRLPRLIGLERASSMLVSGKHIGAKEAVDIGLLDYITTDNLECSDSIETVAQRFLFSDTVAGTSVESRRLSLRPPPADMSAVELETRTKAVVSSSRGLRSPVAAAEAVRASTLPFEQGLRKEWELFAALSVSPQTAALQYQHFSERAMWSSPTLPNSTTVPQIDSVGVVGGGRVGIDISLSLVKAGIPVTLVETCYSKSRAVVDTIIDSLKKYSDVTGCEVDKLCSLITPAQDIAALQNVDIVIEAIHDDLAEKRQVFRQLDAVCKQDTVLTSTSSYFDVGDIGSATTRSRFVVGTHFLAPTNAAGVLEIVRGKETAPEALATCKMLAKRLGNIPLHISFPPAFVGGRIFGAAYREALVMIGEGATPIQIDAALKNEVGLAMGLFEIADMMGNDSPWTMGAYGGDEESDTHNTPFDMHGKLCEKGWIGQKSGKGWYIYDSKTSKEPSQNPDLSDLISQLRADMSNEIREVTTKEIVERCMFSLVNEAFRVLDEGIVGPSHIDLLFARGFGFPRHKGGPLWWAEREIGLTKLFQSLQSYFDKNPKRHWLKPSKFLGDVVESGSSVKEELYFRNLNNKKR